MVTSYIPLLVGGDPGPELAADGQDRVFEVAAEQGVLDLQITDGCHGRGSADRRRADLPEAYVAHVALVDQVCDRADGVLDGHGRVEAGGAVDVDVVHAQALQGVGEEVLHRARSGVDAAWDAVGAAHRAELHRQHDAVAVAALQRSADQLFVVAAAVEVAGVQQGAAGVEVGADDLHTLVIIGRAVAPDRPMHQGG